MERYKIVSSTETQYVDIELPLEFDEVTQQDDFMVLGKWYVVTQLGGGIVILSNKDNVMTLQQQDPPKPTEPEITVIDDPSQLQINREIDIFFETKEIRFNFQGNLTKEHGMTYDALYRFLQKEWVTIAKAYPEYSIFPMEHAEGTNNYCFLDSWNWLEDYTLFLKDGCWSRKDAMGRHI